MLILQGKLFGEVSEWFKVTISKVVVGATPPRVRIPASPYKKERTFVLSFLLQKADENPARVRSPMRMYAKALLEHYRLMCGERKFLGEE